MSDRELRLREIGLVVTFAVILSPILVSIFVICAIGTLANDLISKVKR